MAEILTRVASVRFPHIGGDGPLPRNVRAWVLGWVREPVELMRDPAPGNYKLTVRFSETEFRELQGLPGPSLSSAIRRIVALYLSEKESSGSKWLKVVAGAAIVLFYVWSGLKTNVGPPGGQNP